MFVNCPSHTSLQSHTLTSFKFLKRRSLFLSRKPGSENEHKEVSKHAAEQSLSSSSRRNA